ncbi:MAG TPA: glycosyltransferase family 2 protein [Pyrinomonadaceae bacterium]|nr:glycosyltransferase family 2 protein [Pyrinomonadaceae bacterium]
MARASVIIATRNRPHLVTRAVQSAALSGSDLEIVVVDDGSSEETGRLCRDLRGVKYVRLEKNIGTGGARNAGIRAATSDYLSFLDDDDVRLAQTLDRQIEILDHEPAVALVYGQALVDSDGTVQNGKPYPAACPQGDVFLELLTQNFIPSGSVLFRRSCLDTSGLLNEKISGIEDWDLWVRIAEHHPVRALDAPVMVWRRSQPGSAQLTSRADRVVALSVQQFQRWMDLPRAAAASSEVRRQVWEKFCVNMAEHLIYESIRALGHRQIRRPAAYLSLLPRLESWTLVRVASQRLRRTQSTSLERSSIVSDQVTNDPRS